MNLALSLLVFNTLIAVFLTAIGAGGKSLVENLIWSHCIGGSIGLLIAVSFRWVPWGMKRWLVVVVATPVGAGLGIMLAEAITGIEGHTSAIYSQTMAMGLFFGAIGSVIVFMRERHARMLAELEARELARVEAEKRGIEAQLKMLQAQVEPHFLFNSLANVASLIEADPPLAGRLLDALIRYLRASLSRTRAEGGTLGDELGLLTAYLDVLKIRMGARLGYDVEVPGELLAAPMPPMLLQPLVENAIRHGLEPKIEGGRVRIAARREGATLAVTIADDGLGFNDSGKASGSGIGLGNVRARLAALYGERGRLRVEAPSDGGVVATVVIPA